jgi:hemerythrin-like domain-containing protein
VGILRSCDQLRQEHRTIAQVVAGIDVLSRQRRNGADVPMQPVAGAIDFFAGFVAACHEAKEQEVLLPALAACGATNGVLDEVRAEHAEGERLLGMLRPLAARRVDGEAWDALEAYLALLGRHVASEDEVLLPLAERLLSPADDAAMEGAFLRIEDRTLGSGGSHALLALADAVTDASKALVIEPPVARTPLLARQIMRPDRRRWGRTTASHGPPT